MLDKFNELKSVYCLKFIPVSDTVYISKGKEVLGWKTVENSSWIVSAEGRGTLKKSKSKC